MLPDKGVQPAFLIFYMLAPNHGMVRWADQSCRGYVFRARRARSGGMKFRWTMPHSLHDWCTPYADGSSNGILRVGDMLAQMIKQIHGEYLTVWTRPELL